MTEFDLYAQPLTAADFAPYGDVLSDQGPYDTLINAGLCERYDDRAQLDFSGGRAGLSLFKAQLRSLPYTFALLERHPKGSQAFMPLSADGYLVIVARDQGGTPGRPEAFITAPGQAINLHRGTWHGVLTPLAGSGLFAVLDCVEAEGNLEEFHLPQAYTVHADRVHAESSRS